MFGKGLIRIIGMIIAGAIALAAGAQLLASVVSIVIAFRYGNIVPLVIVVALTISIIIFSSRVSQESPAHIIFRILSYAVTGYLAVVAFVIALPFGLIASIIAAGSVGVLSSILTDTRSISSRIKQMFMYQPGLSGLTGRSITVGDGTTYRLNSFRSVLILEKGTRNEIIKLLSERPLLPISYTHFEECDVLFVNETEEPMIHEQILKLLSDSRIKTKGSASPLLAEAIQMVPILDSKHGLKLEDYRIIHDESTIRYLLEKMPVRLTVFPSLRGLCLLVPDNEVPGLNVERLKRGSEVDVLLYRNKPQFLEVDNQIEGAA